MTLVIRNILKLRGEKGIMLNRGKLSREILGLFGVATVISVFVFGFLSITADSIVLKYCEQNNIVLDETLEWTIHSWIQSVSFAAAVFLFIVLFLFLVGQKVAYLKDIIRGIDALRMHRMNYEISLEGNNELTQLAESINYLSQTERELREKEMKIQEDKEQFIRALSHDIRTPLTSILSYSEYMKEREEVSNKEIEDYILLIQQKAEQIRKLTNQLLDEGGRQPEKVENGKLLMEQLVDEWEFSMEGVCECNVNFDECPEFSCEADIQELRRIFDNLASNIMKYADMDKEVLLNVLQKENRLVIEQSNTCRQNAVQTESYKIGIKSIRRIAESYGGYVEVMLDEPVFKIEIALMELT